MPVYKFNSPAEFAKECAKIPTKSRMMGDAEAQQWTGETYKQSLDRSIYGDEKYVEQAEKLLDKLYSEIDIPYPVWQSSMAGAYPSVPDFISNNPMNMRRKITDENDRNPITIYYVTSSSAGHTWQDLLKRGIATLAFAMVLQKMRPVNLKLVATLDGSSSDKCTLIEINIDLNNIAMATAAYAIASTGFDRNLTHTYGHHHNGFSGNWAWFTYPDSPKYWNNLRHYLKMEEQDILIKGAWLHDDMITKDPIAWCKEQIDEYKKKNHADTEYEELPESSDAQEYRAKKRF